MLKNRKTQGALMLLLAALLWGISFVAQDMVVPHIGTFTFQATRSLIGAAFLVPIFLLFDAHKKKTGTYHAPTKADRVWLWAGGAACGVLLCVATCLQQFGIVNDASPGKAAFITALYILFVPIIGLFLKKRAPWHVYLCLPVALGGLWLLCMQGSGLGIADLQLILCAVAFSLQITVVDHVAPRVDGVRLSSLQFFISGSICFLLMLIFEEPTMEGLMAAALPVLYAGIVSSGIAYTLQILGQVRTPAAIACLLMSLESVFALLSDMIIQHARPTPREVLGMAVIFVAIVAAQLELPWGKKAEQPSGADNS